MAIRNKQYTQFGQDNLSILNDYYCTRIEEGKHRH